MLPVEERRLRGGAADEGDVHGRMRRRIPMAKVKWKRFGADESGDIGRKGVSSCIKSVTGKGLRRFYI